MNKIKKMLLALPLVLLLFGCKKISDIPTKPNTDNNTTTENTKPISNDDDLKGKYQISYILNGGTNNIDNPTEFSEGEIISLKPAEKSGYDFLGWATNSKGTSFVDELDLDMDWVVYAVFSPHEYKIQYHNTEGLSNSNPTTYTIVDEAITLNPISDLHINFYGWFDEDDNEITTIDTKSIKNYELYAKYDVIKSIPQLSISAKNLTYNGENQELVSASVDGGTIYYSLDGQTYSENTPKGLNAGTYTVYYKVIGDSTHDDIEEKTITVTIKKNTYDMSSITFNDLTLTYDGEYHSLSYSGTLPEGVSLVNYTNNENKNAGEYNIVANFSGDSINYEEIPSITATLTIEKANITDVEVVGYNAIYDGNTHNAIVSKTASTIDDAVLTWKYGTTENNIIEDEILVKDIETKTYYYKISALNYNDYIGQFDVTVTDKNITSIEITNLNSLSKTYDGTQITTPVIDTNSNGEVTITYSADGINFTSNKPVNAGNYIIKVEAAETLAYAAASIQKSFTISKTNPICADSISVNYNELSGKSYFTTNMNVSNIIFNGEFSTNGTITYSDSRTSLVIGTYAYSYTFTPADLTNYNIVTGTVDITTYATVKYFDNDELVNTLYIAKNAKATNLVLPDRNGYSQAGWTLLDSSNLFDFNSAITNNTNLYSIFSLTEYSIEYHLAGGTLSNPIETYTIETDSFYLPIPTQENKKFIGWTGTGLSVATMDVLIEKGSMGNKSYTANWADLETVAYYLNNTSKTFTTIEKALNDASSGDIVCLIAPEDNNYHSVNNNVSSTSKKTYYITSDCEIKSGVTLVIPTDKAHISSVTSSSTLSTYIDSMKKDGVANSDGNKTNGELETYSKFAKDNLDKYLRVTLEIASGVTLTNNGTLVVSGYLSGGTSNSGMFGQTSHSYSQIILNQNAKIVQSNASAKTYCFGYISEKTLNNSSKVEFNNGTLYIPFIVCDYRGFSFSWAMTVDAIDDNGCSAFNQFDFRNIDAFAKFGYNSTVIGIINTYVSYPSQSVNENFYNELNILGNTTSYVFQLTNQTCSYLTYKFNTSTQVADINIYGGMTLNNLSLNLSKSIVSVNLSTTKGYFPISWRQNIKLLKAEGQTSATYNASKQSIKLQPGAILEIGSGCSFSGKNVVVYTAFGDGESYNGPSSACGYGVTYPLKDGAIFQINDGATASFTSLAGNVYYDNASVTYTNSTIISYEPWTTGPSGSLTPPWTIKDYLEIRESLQKTPISYRTTKQKLYLGTNIFKIYNSNIPSYKVIINSNEYTVSSYQKTIFLDSITTYKVTLVSNISKCLYANEIYYVKNSTVNYDSNAPYFIAINSTTSISSNKNGVNEFDVQSLTMNCTTPKIDGKYPLYPGTTINLEAVITDAAKAYDKAVTWTSSNNNIATVVDGKVTGVSLGSVTITATCDGKTATINLTVIEEQQLDEISYITITDNQGGTSESFKGTNTDGDGNQYNGGNYSNGTDVTVTVHINPSSAPYASIVWTFTASAVGRQYVKDNTVLVETIENQTSVLIHVVSDSGASDDTFNIVCVVTDLQGNEFSAKFVMSHKADISTCLAEGTLVLMADGSKKAIEDINVGDLVVVWDNNKNNFTTSTVTAIWDHGYMTYPTITATFGSNQVKIVSGHSFYDVTLNKYVDINCYNCNDYIGHEFVIYDNGTYSTATLTSAIVKTEYSGCYSLMTDKYNNFISNNIISRTPDPFDNFFEIFEEMFSDQEQLAMDIETYGLYTYEEWQDVISLELFEAYHAAYFKILVGKGLITVDEIMLLVQKYA